jgi:hypothetical protein
MFDVCCLLWTFDLDFYEEISDRSWTILMFICDNESFILTVMDYGTFVIKDRLGKKNIDFYFFD